MGNVKPFAFDTHFDQCRIHKNVGVGTVGVIVTVTNTSNAGIVIRDQDSPKFTTGKTIFPLVVLDECDNGFFRHQCVAYDPV